MRADGACSLGHTGAAHGSGGAQERSHRLAFVTAAEGSSFLARGTRRLAYRRGFHGMSALNLTNVDAHPGLPQTLVGHQAPITSLDFTEPYGIAVTASLDESVRFWDLTTGDELGVLRGHSGACPSTSLYNRLTKVSDLAQESSRRFKSSLPSVSPAARTARSGSGTSTSPRRSEQSHLRLRLALTASPPRWTLSMSERAVPDS